MTVQLATNSQDCWLLETKFEAAANWKYHSLDQEVRRIQLPVVVLVTCSRAVQNDRPQVALLIIQHFAFRETYCYFTCNYFNKVMNC